MTDSKTETHPIVAQLAAALKVAPPDVQEVLAAELGHAIDTAFLRGLTIKTFGPTVPVDEIISLAQIAAESHKEILAADPRASEQITATVLDISDNIGEVIDYSIRRMHGPDGKVISRRAYLDVVCGHATLMRGLTALNDISDDDNGNAAA